MALWWVPGTLHRFFEWATLQLLQHGISRWLRWQPCRKEMILWRIHRKGCVEWETSCTAREQSWPYSLWYTFALTMIQKQFLPDFERPNSSIVWKKWLNPFLLNTNWPPQFANCETGLSTNQGHIIVDIDSYSYTCSHILLHVREKTLWCWLGSEPTFSISAGSMAKSAVALRLSMRPNWGKRKSLSAHLFLSRKVDHGLMISVIGFCNSEKFGSLRLSRVRTSCLGVQTLYICTLSFIHT